MTGALATPGQVMAKLDEIEHDLSLRQNLLEDAAIKWFRAKRDREHAYAVALIQAEGPVDVRKAQAQIESSHIGKEDEALWESLKAVVRVLEARSVIGMSLLRSQGRS